MWGTVSRRGADLRRWVNAPDPRGSKLAPVLTWRTVREIRHDGVLGMAAEAAFWALLSLPPLALALLGAVGYVGEAFGPDAIAEIRAAVVGAAGQVLTPAVMGEVVEPLVDTMLAGGRADVMSAGFVISLWSGSAAMYRYIRLITVAYDLEGLRRVWLTRLLAFALNLGALAVGIVLLPVLVLGPDAVVHLAPGAVTPAATVLVRAAYWPAVAVLSVCALATLYHLSVPVRTPWRRDLPGAVLAMALWVGGSLALRTYLTSSLRNTDYGPLTGPIAALLFLYVAALAILIGAELNSEIDAMRPVESTAEGRERSRVQAATKSEPY